MKELIVDRIENGIILCEDNNCNMLHLISSQIEGVVKEGDVLVERSPNIYYVDNALTKKRKDEINKLMEDMWQE
ncbi:MAG: DUF3006 domain-containing protein [Sarcina sp.]